MPTYKAKTIGDLHSQINIHTDNSLIPPFTIKFQMNIGYVLSLIFALYMLVIRPLTVDASLRSVENVTVVAEKPSGFGETIIRPVTGPVLSEEGKLLLIELREADRISNILQRCDWSCIPTSFCNSIRRKSEPVNKMIEKYTDLINVDEAVKVYNAFSKEKHERLYEQWQKERENNFRIEHVEPIHYWFEPASKSLGT